MEFVLGNFYVLRKGASGLGTAGGLLVAGICIGYLSSLNPTFGRVPAAARYLLRELGLMLLMAVLLGLAALLRRKELRATD